MNVVGQAIGSLLVGGASDAIAGRVFTGGDYRSLCVDATAGGTVAAACEQASAQGLRWAMVGLTVFLVIGSLGYLSAARSAARAQEAS